MLDALRAVRDPEASRTSSTLGLVRDLMIADAKVSFTLAFTGQAPATKATVHSMASRAVGRSRAWRRCRSRWAVRAARRPPQAAPGQAHGHAHAPGRARRPGRDFIPEVRHTIAVSSGKGGVGKSTVTVNLALALRQAGADASASSTCDVYGPDIPLMLGTQGRPGMFDNQIIPVEAHGIKIMSIGLLVNEKEPLVWRGPMIHSFIQQMLKDVIVGRRSTTSSSTCRPAPATPSSRSRRSCRSVAW